MASLYVNNLRKPLQTEVESGIFTVHGVEFAEEHNPGFSSLRALPSQIATSGKVIVSKLAADVEGHDLIEIFSVCGNVLGANVVKSQNTGMHHGFGFVEFSSQEGAQAAVTTLHLKELHGKLINVSFAEPPEIALKNLVLYISRIPSNWQPIHFLYAIGSLASSVRLAKLLIDRTTGESLGKMFVTFRRKQAMTSCQEMLNGAAFEGQQIEVKRSHSGRPQIQLPSPPRPALFVGNLGVGNVEDFLDILFAPYNYLNFKIICRPTGNKRGYAFVNFSGLEDAVEAEADLNRKLLNDGELLLVQKRF